MVTSIARRSTFLRTLWTTTTSSSSSTPTTNSNSIRSNIAFRHIRISPSPAPSRFIRRELSSLLPVHSAIASACLVSKLPNDVIASNEGRFANYLSPI